MVYIEKDAVIENIERIVQQLSLKSAGPDDRLMIALRIRDAVMNQCGVKQVHKDLTVGDIVKRISGQWQLIGGSTGRKLAASWSGKATKDKYMDCIVTDQPLFPALQVQTCKITHTGQRAKPVICIWVSGR